jgi:creatinine amidohydrolase
VAVLPLGAVEAHGPHLPLITDGIIAEAMAEEGARRLVERGVDALVLPTIDYAPAPFARAFPGTLSIRPQTLTALLIDVAAAAAASGAGVLAVANAHLDPAHLGAVREAVEAIGERGAPLVAWPDLTRRRWAERLTEEFRSGACHAGRYEGSVVLERRPEWVLRKEMSRLVANPASLVTAIRQGRGSFAEAGGPEAYFGDPAAASAEEGRETVAKLGELLLECVLETLAASDGNAVEGTPSPTVETAAEPAGRSPAAATPTENER